MKRMGMVMVLVLAMAGLMQGAELQPLGVPEATWADATHCWTLKYSDLTISSTNTAETITNRIPTNAAVECTGMRLVNAFDTGNTNYTGSLSLKVGDGSTTDLYLTSTELASDGTEVWLKFPPPHSATVTATYQTNSFLVAGGTTSTLVTCNAVTAAATIGELGRKLYTSSGSIVATLTPNAEEGVSANTAGEVQIFFRIRQRR